MTALYMSRLYEVKGDTATIIHNGRMANPLDLYVKANKKLSAKQKKSEDDFAAIAVTEWEGSLYTDPPLPGPNLGSGKEEVCWPGRNIKAMLVTAGKKRKLGKKIGEAILVFDESNGGMFPLRYEGPKDWRKLRDDPNYRLMSMVRVSQARIMRCRPMFMPWSLAFTVQYLPDQIDSQDLDDVVAIGGRIIGLSDWRPEYGKYHIVKIDGKAV